MSNTLLQSPARVPHPSLFAILMYPFGAMAGYLTVTLAYQLSQAGISTEAYEALVAVSFVPNITRFLWAPVVDITLSPRIWYCLSAIVGALSMVWLAFTPPVVSALWMMSAAVFVGNIVITFNSMAVDILAASSSPPEQKGRFGGWLQAGNLAGGGIGGGVALLIAQHVSGFWVAGVCVGASFLLCPLALLTIPAVASYSGTEKVVTRVVAVARDSWMLARSRAGALAILVLFLPLGTGAASNLFSNIADDWHTSATVVSWTNGILSGPVSAIGCLIGGYLCDRMDRKWSYAVFGLIQAACCVAMAFAPRDPVMYSAFVLLYAFIAGLTYAAFCALTLEVIGVSAAATQYNLLACLSNVPIMYMGYLEGVVHTHSGLNAMLYTEAGAGLAAAVVYVAIRQWTMRAPLAASVA